MNSRPINTLLESFCLFLYINGPKKYFNLFIINLLNQDYMYHVIFEYYIVPVLVEFHIRRWNFNHRSTMVSEDKFSPGPLTLKNIFTKDARQLLIFLIRVFESINLWNISFITFLMLSCFVNFHILLMYVCLVGKILWTDKLFWFSK